MIEVVAILIVTLCLLVAECVFRRDIHVKAD